MKRKRLMAVLLSLAMVMTATPQSAAAKTVNVKNAGTKKVMPVGSSFTLATNMKASKLTFTSTKKNVASVSKNGQVVAKKTGKATIKIKQKGKKGNSKTVNIVVKKPTGYTISAKTGKNLYTIGSLKLKAKKGYRVYYTTSGTFKTSQKLKSGKTLEMSVTSAMTLKVFAVKNGKKVTKAYLNRKKISNRNYGEYTYSYFPPCGGTGDGSTPPAKQTATPAATQQTTEATASPNPSPTTGSGQKETPPPAEKPTMGPPPVGPTAEPTPKGAGDSGYTGDDAGQAYVEPTKAEYTEADMDDTIPEEATQITIPVTPPTGKISESNYELSKKNKLTITAEGTYVIRTEDAENTAVNGLIEVKKELGTVHLILDGVHLTSDKMTSSDMTEDTGLITIGKGNTKVIITANAGTVNTLTDVGETGVDAEDASVTYPCGILSKKETPLTINGSGTINITSPNGSGIVAKNLLKIVNTTVHVGTAEQSVGHNGISGKLGLFTKEAALEVYSENDAVKNTLDSDDLTIDEGLTGTELETRQQEVAALSLLGNIELDGGTYVLDSQNGDAISAFRTLSLNPASLTATTHAVENVGKTADEAQENDGSYKAVKAGTTIYVADTAGNITLDTTDTCSESRTHGDTNDPAADDTLHCDGSIKIDGGTIRITSGDDGIHADSGVMITGGDVRITEAFEGIEGVDVTISGGTISVISRDDGINAGGGNNASGNDGFISKPGETSATTKSQIIISGGTITVDAQGDGLDSNGNIFIKGGSLTINGPTNGGNGALDYGDQGCVCEISGGTLIAAGAKGMDQSPTDGSSQPTVNVQFSNTQAAQTIVVIKDSSGSEVMRAVPTKQFQSVVLSCDQFVLGEDYTIWYGTSEDSLAQDEAFSFTSVSVKAGSGSNSSQGNWGIGKR